MGNTWIGLPQEPPPEIVHEDHTQLNISDSALHHTGKPMLSVPPHNAAPVIPTPYEQLPSTSQPYYSQPGTPQPIYNLTPTRPTVSSPLPRPPSRVSQLRGNAGNMGSARVQAWAQPYPNQASYPSSPAASVISHRSDMNMSTISYQTNYSQLPEQIRALAPHIHVPSYVPQTSHAAQPSPSENVDPVTQQRVWQEAELIKKELLGPRLPHLIRDENFWKKMLALLTRPEFLCCGQLVKETYALLIDRPRAAGPEFAEPFLWFLDKLMKAGQPQEAILMILYQDQKRMQWLMGLADNLCALSILNMISLGTNEVNKYLIAIMRRSPGFGAAVCRKVVTQQHLLVVYNNLSFISQLLSRNRPMADEINRERLYIRIANFVLDESAFVNFRTNHDCVKKETKYVHSLLRILKKLLEQSSDGSEITRALVEIGFVERGIQRIVQLGGDVYACGMWIISRIATTNVLERMDLESCLKGIPKAFEDTSLLNNEHAQNDTLAFLMNAMAKSGAPGSAEKAKANKLSVLNSGFLLTLIGAEGGWLRTYAQKIETGTIACSDMMDSIIGTLCNLFLVHSSCSEEVKAKILNVMRRPELAQTLTRLLNRQTYGKDPAEAKTNVEREELERCYLTTKRRIIRLIGLMIGAGVLGWPEELLNILHHTMDLHRYPTEPYLRETRVELVLYVYRLYIVLMDRSVNVHEAIFAKFRNPGMNPIAFAKEYADGDLAFLNGALELCKRLVNDREFLTMMVGHSATIRELATHGDFTIAQSATEIAGKLDSTGLLGDPFADAYTRAYME
ncbi:unnamed protein product, partial [Mesorhabditis spiculigera]